jgi:type IV pilus assembly protein PilB
MTDNPLVASGTQSPVEHLRALAIDAFPERSALKSTPIGKSLVKGWSQLSDSSGLSPWELASGIGRILKIPVAENLEAADLNSARLIPEQLARSALVLPLNETGGELHVACAYPFIGGGVRRVRFASDRKLKLYIAPAQEIERAITLLYSKAAERQSLAVGSLLFSNEPSKSFEDGAVEESAVVRLAQGLILKAVEQGASDMHIQPFAGGGMVRIRVDGILRRLAFLPGPVVPALIRYIKANSAMDPTSDRIAQDGRVSAFINERDFDMRISVLPASRGERLVMRFLDQNRVYRLSASSFSIAELRAFRRMASNSSGILLLTGPTGSGKTSTLYSLLAELNRVSESIITVENPVEYRLNGISQVEINNKAGLTFAAALRSILRQDPDIILIGEIRDKETAEIAMQAAMTGHLVLTTLHTNDAITAIPRLLDLGIERSVLGEALIGVVSQRLLRRLCKKCRTPVTEPYRREELLFRQVTGEWPGFRSVGCEDCGKTGYAGRLPVTEIIENSPVLADAISSGVSLSKLREMKRGPLTSIAVTAALRVISGGTSVLEAVRVIGTRFWLATAAGFNRPPPSESTLIGPENEMAETSVCILVFARRMAQAEQIGKALEQEYLNGIQAEAPEGFKALLSDTPERCRELIEKNENTTLIVADITPGEGENAFDLLKKLRRDLAWAQLPALPIIRPEDQEVRQALETHGLGDYLIHPVTPEHIAARARAILKG